MGRSWNDAGFVPAAQSRGCGLVHVGHRPVESPDDERGGRSNYRQVLHGEIRPAPRARPRHQRRERISAAATSAAAAPVLAPESPMSAT